MVDLLKTHILDVPNNTNPKWYKDKGIRKNVYHCMGLCLCVFYLGYDQSLLACLQSIPQWDEYFDNPTGITLGLISSALYFPGIPAAFVGSWISMKYGRKPALWVGSVLIIIGAIVNALSKNQAEFAGGRVLLGAGGAITKVVAPALLQEIAHPRLRPVLASSYYGWYFLGSIVSGYLCLAGLYIPGSWSWRLACIAQIMAPIGVIIISFSMPESPRFLANRGKFDEALSILAKYHANGKLDDPLVQLEYNEMVLALEAEGGEHKSSFLDFFRFKGNRRRLVMSLVMASGTNWNGSGLVGYYLTPILESIGITDPVKTINLNNGMNIWNLVVSEVAALYVEAVSRRTIFFISGWGMVVTMALVGGFSAGYEIHGNVALGIASIPMLFLYYGLYDIAWMSIPFHYCTEIQPFHLRTKGLAMFVAMQTGSNAFNQFVNPIAFEKLTWRYYFVYVAINLAYMAYFYFYLIDSRNMSLEEITLLFDYPRKEARERATEEMESRVRAGLLRRGSTSAAVDALYRGDSISASVTSLHRDHSGSIHNRSINEKL
ncbi:hypothetical protein CspHIS471_0211910 [Cutaneotrichosporon sp. HIS471]|nr:hypothetical protein CspHIS471_0211910 [Cutaneotrichosporon sp. HIS471]